MTAEDPQRPRVLLTATSPEGDRLELVAYGAGGCGVSRNGVPIRHVQWQACRIDAATGALLRLAKLDGGAGGKAG